MTELVSEHTVGLLAGFTSLLGVAALVWWLHRPGSLVTGALMLVVSLAWPLWQLFSLLDEWLDTTTLVGMLIPYPIFILIGLAAAMFARTVARREINVTHDGGRGVEDRLICKSECENKTDDGDGKCG